MWTRPCTFVTFSAEPSVGGGATQRVDMRVIAATNRALEAEVQAERFRADLFYRLNVARLIVPPLRERGDDVGLLVRHVIAEFNHQEGARVGPPDAVLLACLRSHDWPGNIRELRNLIEAVFIDPPVGRLGLEHLGVIVERERAEPDRVMKLAPGRGEGGLGVADQRHGIIRGRIVDVDQLERHGLRAQRGDAAGEGGGAVPGDEDGRDAQRVIPSVSEGPGRVCGASREIHGATRAPRPLAHARGDACSFQFRSALPSTRA